MAEAQDFSLAHKTDFLMTIAKLPGVTFYLQDVQIPALNLSSILQATPRLDYPRIGDKMQFDPLSISFLVDENYLNYYELFSWTSILRDPNAKPNPGSDYSDITVTILNNNKNPIVEFTFVDAFPISIDGLLYDVSAAGDDAQVANCTLEYTLYTMKLINTNPGA